MQRAVARTYGGQTTLDRLLRAPFQGLLKPLSYRALRRLLRDEEIRRRVVHTLSDEFAIRESSFLDVPPGLDRIDGFEDCFWLFSSNELNHGLSRLRLDEAAYLYRIVRSFDQPRVAELGRYKGGSAFLMAAAGAAVLSMDNGRLPGQQAFVSELVSALVRFGLRDNVEIVNGDARTYPVDPDTFDIVFFDCMYSFVTTRTIFEHWWPAVRAGGTLIFRDGKDSLLTEAVRYVSTLEPADCGAEADPHAPGSFVVFRKL